MPSVRENTKENMNALLRLYRSEITKESILSYHHHTSVEFCCILSGCGKVGGDSGEIAVSEGDVLLFAPGQAHMFSAREDSLSMLTLHFEPRYIWQSQSGFSGTELLGALLNPPKDYCPRLSGKISEYVFSKILEAEQELKSRRREYECAVKTLIVQILIFILRQMSYDKRPKNTDARLCNISGLEKTIDYIDANIKSDLDLYVLSEISGMSKSYFCTVFKRYNGIKPWDYITIKRIDKALRLIMLSPEKKMNIAADCGFNNAANFYRAFKKITGRTPGDYEKLSIAMY